MPLFAGAVGIDRHDMHIAVTNAAFCDQGIGKGADFLETAAQDNRFQAIVMVEMHVHGRDADVVMRMLARDKSAGQFALMVVVDVADRGNAKTGFLHDLPVLLQMTAQEVPKRFRAIDIAASFDQVVELLRQGFVNGDGDASHKCLPRMGYRILHRLPCSPMAER